LKNLFPSVVSIAQRSHLGLTDTSLRLAIILCSLCGCVFASHGQIVLLNSGYDVIALGDATINNGYIPGRMAAFGDATIKNSTTIGTNATDSLPIVYSESDLSISGWSTINNGNAVYRGDADIKHTNFTSGYGAYKVSSAHTSPFSSNSVRAHFENVSQSLAALQNNGTVSFQWGNLTLSGNQSLNVFNIRLDDYKKLNQIGIVAPSGSTVIVNIFGDKIKAFNGYLNGVEASHVLFNFSEANSLDFKDTPIPGSYLAPYATISGTGYFDGQLVGNDITFHGISMSGNQFTGTLPVSAIPEPAFYSLCLGSIALLVFGLKRFKPQRVHPLAESTREPLL